MTGGEQPAFLAFTEKGFALAQRLQAAMGGRVTRAGRGSEEPFSLQSWTADAFAAQRKIVFVGAVGIAVRAVAPHLRSKATDPAVVAVDELGRFAVPICSGHLGGANDLARQVAGVCGAVPVITTATDCENRFAVDEWARRQNCAVAQPWKIKDISARVLAGETIAVRSAWPVRGTPPAYVRLGDAGADVVVDLYRGGEAEALCLVPRVAVLGIGCRRDTPQETVEQAFRTFCEELGVWEQAVCEAATIDWKMQEPGLLAFCRAHGWPVRFFSAEALERLEGEFTGSPFVKRTVGVDNVCERSAALASGGALIGKKYVFGGVTLAMAQKPYEMDWTW